jgi:hypothetical protein
MTNYLPYLSGWVAACVLAVIIGLKRRSSLELLQSAYWAFIFMPWKVVTFLIAATGMLVIAPYTGDPTWDYFDASGMALLTYLTAPWSVGIFFRFFKKQAAPGDLYVAVCLLLFTSSWFYDGYILVRDGVYPGSWLQNLIISPTLYLSGGLFWNLAWARGEGVRFAFQWPEWHRHRQEQKMSRIIWLMLPFMIFAAYSILWFAGDEIETWFSTIF